MSRFNSDPAISPSPGARRNFAEPLDVTIGIDFGTSAAKVAFREFGGRQSMLIASAQGLLQWPCVIQVRQNRLHFSSDVGSDDGAQIIRGLKMLLAEEYGRERDGYREHMRALVANTGCSVQAMSAFLLAYFMRYARDAARRFYAERGRPVIHLTYNIGAPLETFADNTSLAAVPTVSDGFLKVAYWAEKLIEHIPTECGWDLAEAKERFDAISKLHPDLPATKTVFVVPETHAVVTGAVLARGQLESGNYVVVDIGAGTTDVAVFLYNSVARKDGRWAVTYLSDAVKHEASTHADRCIAELLNERIQRLGRTPPRDAMMLDLARSVKEQSDGKRPIQTMHNISLSPEDVSECTKELTNRLFRHYQKTLIRSLNEKTTNGLRQPFYLLLMGGGSRFAPLRQCFLGSKPDPNHPKLQAIETWVSLRDHLRVITNAGVGEIPTRDFEIYSLVHGLTTHIVRLPAFWRPDDVEAFPPPPPADQCPYFRMDDD